MELASATTRPAARIIGRTLHDGRLQGRAVSGYFTLTTSYDIKGVRVTTQSSRRYEGGISRHEAPRAGEYFRRGGEVVDRFASDDSDILAIEEGFISVTPLHVGLARRDALETWRQVLSRVSGASRRISAQHFLLVFPCFFFHSFRCDIRR